MQKMLCYVLLATGLAWADTALGQFPGAGFPASPFSLTPKMQKTFACPWTGDLNFQKSGPRLLRQWNSGIDQSPGVRTAGNASVRIMNPDRMGCLVPDLKRVELMPVRHLSNINPMDKMPNAWPR
jgi:hypothetical protein